MAGVHVPNNLREKNDWTHKALNSEWVMWPNKQLTAYHIISYTENKTKWGKQILCCAMCINPKHNREKKKTQKFPNKQNLSGEHVPMNTCHFPSDVSICFFGNPSIFRKKDSISRLLA